MTTESAAQSLFLAGTHSVNMDPKGRISLPAVWRSTLRETCRNGEASFLYVVNDFQYPSLRLYSHSAYSALSQRIESCSDPRWKRLLNQHFFGTTQALEVQFEEKSRALVRINRDRREHARLAPGDEMSLIGEGRMLSLWRTEWLELKLADQPVPHTESNHRVSRDILMEYDLWEERDERLATGTSR